MDVQSECVSNDVNECPTEWVKEGESSVDFKRRVRMVGVSSLVCVRWPGEERETMHSTEGGSVCRMTGCAITLTEVSG